ncbi:MAG: hypothetical protein GTO45_19815 [Candidatus Aminicenantes bacterium]|nr:hypothetical protein [Candidatus Aminicenantes bacterium]NIM81039.1 hypothetical protein [Candidatus Aminicenantes bacterium]NIN20418.1 hypothetical protein [Candidatus Aminicenantes bacterium]NIN44191.1 hypothetical protein [Candidatus Aminicenantes bacterium]NIN87009.1 hypothetical protein [Candidatus Aminicenantes bacterium]
MKQTISYKMNVVILLASLGILFRILLFPAEQLPDITGSGLDLTEIFKNQLVIDTNHDHVPDDIAARFLMGNQASSPDIEAAAAVAARLGFETSAMDPFLCISGWDEAQEKRIQWLITFTAIKTKTYSKENEDKSNTKENSGIKVYRKKGVKVIEIFGTTPQARRYAAVNFFSRFPYIWDVTGRETGELWDHVKQDILSQLPEPDRKNAYVRITAVHYRYQKPLEKSMNKRRLERLGLSGTIQKKGEVGKVEVELVTPTGRKNVTGNLKNLIIAHQRGERTNILNYAGVKDVEIHILSKDEKKRKETITVSRTAVPQRFLNPSTDPSFFSKKVTIKDVKSDLAGFYTNKGIYKDTNSDGFADRLVSRIIYDGFLPYKVINLAARLGLEDCTVSLPFTMPADDLDMKTIKNLERPILIGTNNRFSDYLGKIGKARTPQLKQDEGFIQFCPGFNPGGVYIISGSSLEGENAALQYAAATLPFISASSTQPGAPEWEDLNREIELFFTRKNDAGIAAWGILQIDKQKKAFSAPDLEQSKTQLYTMRHVKNLDHFISKRIQSKQKLLRGVQGGGFLEKSPPGRRRHKVKTGGRLEPAEGFSDKYTPQWEVEEAREIFTQKILPKLQTMAKGELFIDLRLSEPLEVLEQQVKWIKDMVVKAGFKEEEVKIRAVSAYKQGFHWIKDNLIPRIKASHAASIKIRFSDFPLNFEETRKYWPEAVRWLQELYPIDEILAKELDIPLEAIHFIKDETLKEAIYEFTALSKTGDTLFKETFSPFTTEIHFQDRFEDWGKVMVCTGGIRVKWGDQEIFSSTIDTDPLRLWKHYQGKILPKLTEMVEKQAGGPLKMEDQPFFSQLQTKVWMSEPDYRLGLDEELVSSLESFHEDFYFNTLDYFKGLVKKDPDMKVEDPLMAQRWASPGNIIPIIHPSRIGKGPLMETVVTGLESLSPKVEMEFHYHEVKEPLKITKKITPLKKMKAPRLTCIVVDNKARAREAVYTLEFKNEEELSQAVDMLGILEDLQRENIFTKTFSHPGLLTIRFILKAPQRLQSQFVLNIKESGPGDSLVSSVPAGPLTRDYLNKALAKVMSPEETLEMAKRLGTLPEIDYYIGGYSYQGRAVPVLEMGLKPKGKIMSRRKITTYKPTVFLLGRQHANEVSSTNYGFYIAWLLAKDPGYRKYLQQLNIVIEPMENPDGSALAVELQELTPHHMLHAGRYSALGSDIGFHVSKPDTLITEARVRKKLYDRWQPDIFLNNHGYPSHEWVQQFSNYTPYLFRVYWIPRGWYYFHVGLNRIETPLHKKAGERIVEIISEKMQGDKEVFAVNQRIYDRYRRWAERWQPHIHYLELYDGTNIYKKRRRSTAARMSRRREITVLEAIPEAMDETARDEWLRLSIRQGTLFVTAFMDLAMESQKPIERIEDEVEDIVHLQIIRHRPIRVNSLEK